MAVERSFLVKLLADPKQLLAAFDQVRGETEGKLVGAFGKVAIASAAAFAASSAFAGKAAFAAAEDAAEQEKLATSLRNTVGATDEAIAATEEFISQLARTTTFTDSEMRPALDALVRSTGDVASAQQQLQLAQDVAVGTGRPLVEVADALAKANAGNYKSLQALSPALKDNIKEGAGLNEVFKELSATFGGQASAAAGTLQGQMTILRNRFGEVVEAIGASFLPILEAAVTVLGGVASILENNSTAFAFLITFILTTTGLIVALSLGLKVYTIATAAAAAANLAFSASLSATGIGAIVVLIGLAVSALVIAAQKSEGFRNALVGAINFITKSLEQFINMFLFLYNKVILGALNGLSAALKFVGIDLGTIKEIGTVSFGAIGDGADDARGKVSIFNAELAATQGALVRFASGIKAEGFARLQSVGALEKYNQGVKDQIRSSGGARKSTEEAITPLQAYTKVLDGARSASDSYERSTRRLRDAKKGLKDADLTLAEAQKQLMEAQQAGSEAEVGDARRAVAAAERSLTRSKFDQEASIFAVRDAEKRLSETRQDSKSTAQDIRKAEIDLEEAKLRVVDSQDSQIETSRRLEEVNRNLRIATEGLREGDKELVPFQDAVTQAQERQISAAEAHRDAIKEETSALADYREELDKLATAIIKFPKASVNVGQSGLIPLVPASAEMAAGSTTGTTPATMNVVVNAGIGANSAEVAVEVAEYLRDFTKVNGPLGNFLAV